LKTGRHPAPFPRPKRANEDGVLAVGARPEPDLLLAAYRRGIFPWPHEGMPLPWFSPDPRFALRPDHVHIGRSLRKTLRSGAFEVRADTAFEAVVAACARIPRPDQLGTWITPEMFVGYRELHRRGFAHSIETWRQGRLVGGLYGLSLGRVFFGESMFALEPDASKVAFATLAANLVHWRFQLIDCQAQTEHLARFGATNWTRNRFLVVLRNALALPDRRGKWELELGPVPRSEKPS
jgi:leucyl/phenylalanyl-tRNA---protein transferase